MTSVLIVGMGVVPPVALKLLSDDRRSRSARVPSMPAALIDAFALTRRLGSSHRCFLHLRVAGQLQPHEFTVATIRKSPDGAMF